MEATLLYKNIFLAEDDEDDAYFFGQALEELHSDINLVASSNGKELMDLLNVPPTPPDIIFMDLNMPLKNGYECLKEIREFENDIPVIILTTTANPEDIDKMYHLGATHFIVKPNNFPDLKEILKKVLSAKWLKDLQQPERKHFVISV